MHIVVCVKQVPDTSDVRVNPKTNTLVREGVPAIVNPYDTHAVEEAVRLKEEHGGKVTLVSMGPSQAEDSLRKALTFGADRAILLTDRGFAGSDTLATSYILARAIRKLDSEEPVDLVLCGKQAIDGDTAQVGPGIARRLGYPLLTYVMKIESISTEEREITVHRKLEGGRAVVKTKLPALLTVVKDINELRYAPLPYLINAARARVDRWGAADLEAEPHKIGLKGSPTSVVSIFAPPARPGGEMVPGGMDDPAAAAAALVDRLVTLKVVADR